MEKIVKSEQQLAIDNNVAVVDAKIKADADARLVNKVVETPEQTKARTDTETYELNVANGLVTPDEKVHFEARAARILAVQNAILAAKVKRDLAEKGGLVETEGVKIDRLAKEDKDLTDAAVLNKIEPFGVESTRPDLVLLAKKSNEIITFLNTPVAVVKPIKTVV